MCRSWNHTLTIAPIHLSFIYPAWTIRPEALLSWLPIAAAAIVTIALWRLRAQALGRALLAAWLVFVGALVPVLGLTNVYFMRFSLVADHYAYFALIALAALVGAGAAAAGAWRPSAGQAIKVGAMALVLVLAIATWRQSRQYADASTLYRATLEANPACWLCETNLAVGLMASARRSDLDSAVERLHASLRIHPSDAETHDALGVALQMLERWDDAIAEHERAVQLNPYLAQTRINLAIARRRRGLALAAAERFDEAAAELRRSLESAPRDPVTHRELAFVLLRLGRADAALNEATAAQQLDPSDAATHDALASIWRSMGQADRALDEWREAVRLAPASAEWQNNLGSALLDADRLTEALPAFVAAVRLDPSSALAQRNLGVTLAELGRLAEAEPPLAEAVRLQPDFADARENLAEVRQKLGKE
jgi:tetratricopeptide (TPR) repeat protein